MAFSKIDPKSIKENVIALIGDRWMLVTAGDKESYNTMTASWGGLGVLWKMPVATSYIRPQRYTFEFMEKNTYYSLSFYRESFRDKLSVCGSKSGRDIDKAKECALTPAVSDSGAVYFEEAELVIVCKKLYYSDFDPEHFLDERIKYNYNPDDYHRMYIGEIVEVLKKV